MRFAVLADLHIGRSIPLAIAEHRRAAFERALTKAVDAIITANVDYVFICGDLFERRTLRPHMVEFTQRELYRLAQETKTKHSKSLRILVVRGNHDGRSQSDALDYIRHPLAGYLHVFGDEDITYRDDRLDVVGLNYYDQIDVAYEKLAKPALKGGKGVKVLMLHGFVAGYNDVPPGDSSVSLDQLAASGTDYVFTGHYHRRCEPKRLKGGGWVLTPGSTEVYDFAEEPEKGFYLVDTDGPRFTWVPIEPLHMMRQAKVGNDRSADPKWYEANAVETLRGFVNELHSHHKQGYIRIKLEGTLSEGWPSDVSEERIREAIPDPLLLWVDVDTLELNLPPSVARPMEENTDVAEYFRDFGDFAEDIREVHGRVREALEEDASTKTGLLTATQREQFIVDWVRRFEARGFQREKN
ncbi:MAG: DNA repair exonuclease [Candidatus Bathyarchaeota archaeon]|nr:DNA repair exonuclease [Candidatus Bathyarchaeota archaeon]